MSKDTKSESLAVPSSITSNIMNGAKKVGNLGSRIIKRKYSIIYIDKLYLDNKNLVENYELEGDPIVYKEDYVGIKFRIGMLSPLALFKAIKKLTSDAMNDEDSGKQKTYKSKKNNDYGLNTRIDVVSKLIKNKFYNTERYIKELDEDKLKAFRKGLKSYTMDDYSTFIYDKYDNAIIGFREGFMWK